VRNPEFGTRPRVYYKNLERGHHEFIAGCAVRDHDGITDVVIGAKVRITDTNGAMIDTVTDDFGDFRVDRLPRESGPYEVVVEHEGATATATVERLDRSRFVGRMKLR
jgi:phosphatidate phosphatase APP1